MVSRIHEYPYTNSQSFHLQSVDHLNQLFKVRDWCEEYNVLFKLNTVVNKFNYQEDMIEPLKKLNPVRWKVFQCLPVEVNYFT